MSKTGKIIFALINVVYFVFNYFIIPYLPNPLVWGWMPGQLLAYLAAMLFAAAFWGVYFNAFFNTQTHNDVE